MCGIFGAVRFQGQEFPASQRDLLYSLTDLVRHRGPDDRGGVCLSLGKDGGRVVADGPFNLFLGHRRLSILDLSNVGRQPMWRGDDLVCVFNGEIFNYLEIKAELQATGHEFRTRTDTEVLLAAYQEFGSEVFSRCNGMWAVALVDLRRNLLVLSRDRFSEKPLFIKSGDGQLVFGSEAKQLMGFGHQGPDPRVLRQYLLTGVGGYWDHTFFKGISSLPPRTVREVDLTSGVSKEYRYWEYPEERSDAKLRSTPGRFRSLLMDSTAIRLRSDVPTAVLVSGGLDSSTISLVAGPLVDRPLVSFSTLSDEPGYDERRFIDALSAADVNPRRIILGETDIPTLLPEVIRANDEPFPGLQVLGHYKMLQAIRQESDVKVVLGGQGADEILGGYRKYFFLAIRDFLRQMDPLRAMRLLMTGALRHPGIRQFSLPEAVRYLPPWMAPRRTFIRPGPVVTDFRGETTFRSRQVLDLERLSVPVLARYEDRNSMAHGIELRSPFLDHRLVSFSLGLPTSQKIRGGWAKWPLRAAFPELPVTIRWRKDKQGFLTAEEHWLRTQLRGAMRSLGGDTALADLGLLEPEAFRTAFAEFLGKRGGVWFQVFSRVLIAEIWLREFFSSGADEFLAS